MKPIQTRQERLLSIPQPLVRENGTSRYPPVIEHEVLQVSGGVTMSASGWPRKVPGVILVVNGISVRKGPRHRISVVWCDSGCANGAMWA